VKLWGDALTKPAEPALRTYTTAQVAEILHLNRATVRQLIRSGRLGHLEISPRQFLVGHDQLEAFIAHFRPGRTAHGWRTAVEGDGKGFPDLLLVHPDAGFVWFVELKRDDNKGLQPEQAMWRESLIAAGAVHRIVHVPSGVDAFLADLVDARETRLRAKRRGMQ
jgi:excisionase family DNA binding protein